ncbi:perforin-like protein PLP1 [Besnoitia besnoiti]|uniref:Perforin-like protein PLP1 n=1 Tax=Besnoitia besnoiti TaxID=94643 RepID=A0A2A9MHG5_BESBE|nr:perforin-like protein PLP1 [Besnoitia besnoiti]PFH37339.1 perforin-like protein PLP1 [Besnoitia besnoiti]
MAVLPRDSLPREGESWRLRPVHLAAVFACLLLLPQHVLGVARRHAPALSGDLWLPSGPVFSGGGGAPVDERHVVGESQEADFSDSPAFSEASADVLPRSAALGAGVDPSVEDARRTLKQWKSIGRSVPVDDLPEATTGGERKEATSAAAPVDSHGQANAARRPTVPSTDSSTEDELGHAQPFVPTKVDLESTATESADSPPAPVRRRRKTPSRPRQLKAGQGSAAAAAAEPWAGVTGDEAMQPGMQELRAQATRHPHDVAKGTASDASLVELREDWSAYETVRKHHLGHATPFVPASSPDYGETPPSAAPPVKTGGSVRGRAGSRKPPVPKAPGSRRKGHASGHEAPHVAGAAQSGMDADASRPGESAEASDSVGPDRETASMLQTQQSTSSGTQTQAPRGGHDGSSEAFEADDIELSLDDIELSLDDIDFGEEGEETVASLADSGNEEAEHPAASSAESFDSDFEFGDDDDVDYGSFTTAPVGPSSAVGGGASPAPTRSSAKRLPSSNRQQPAAPKEPSAPPPSAPRRTREAQAAGARPAAAAKHVSPKQPEASKPSPAAAKARTSGSPRRAMIQQQPRAQAVSFHTGSHKNESPSPGGGTGDDEFDIDVDDLDLDDLDLDDLDLEIDSGDLSAAGASPPTPKTKAPPKKAPKTGNQPRQPQRSKGHLATPAAEAASEDISIDLDDDIDDAVIGSSDEQADDDAQGSSQALAEATAIDSGELDLSSEDGSGLEGDGDFDFDASDEGGLGSSGGGLEDALGGALQGKVKIPGTGIDLNKISKETKKRLGKARSFKDFGKGMGDARFQQEVAGQRLSAPDVKWEHRQPMQIREDTDVYKQAHDTAPSLDFLGSGYDMLKGNPLGDPETSMDPGFRSPVVRFHWTHGPYGVTNDLNLLQPVGGFVRPFVSCRQSESVDEISTMSDYQAELTADASAGGGGYFVSFSASTGYRDMAQNVAKDNERSFFMKTYCFRYEAGLSDSPAITWNTTYGFQHTLMDLPVNFRGLDNNSTCMPFIYKTTPLSTDCQEMGVTKWMSFFDRYGTHVTTNLKLGGKMIHEIKVKSADVDALKDSGISVAAEVSASFMGFSASAKASSSSSTSQRDASSKLKKTVTTRVIGGRPPKDPTDPSSIVLWSKTVEDLPMPIQMELRPLEHFLPHQFREAYRKAAIYYGRAFGMSPTDLDGMGSDSVSLADRLQSGHSVVWGGTAPGYLQCPGKEVIIAGFSILFNFRDMEADPNDYHMQICRPGLRKCEGASTTGNSGDDARMWAICGPSSMTSIRQFIVEGLVKNDDPEATLELRCPQGTEVAWGLKLAVGYGPGGAAHSYIGHCNSGRSTCTMDPRPEASRRHARRFIYAACIESGYPGVREIQAISNNGDIGYANKGLPNSDGNVVLNCGDGNELLLGWTIENHTREEQVRPKFLTCPPGKQICTMKGAGIDDAPLVGGQRKFRDTHALLGYGLCIPSKRFNPHPEEKAAPLRHIPAGGR